MSKKNIRDLSTATAYDSDNDKLGSVKEVYVNDGTGQPDFVEVGHGLFGMNSSLVPLRGHRLEGEELRLAFSKDRIKDAPNLDADAHLSGDQLDTLYRHYGLEETENIESYDGLEPSPQHARPNDRMGATGPDAAAAAPISGEAAQTPTERVKGIDTAQTPVERVEGVDAAQTPAERVEGVDADHHREADESGELTRSEEQLRVSKDREATGQARLRKYVVHDTETVEVPVEREEVHVERTPVDPNDPAANRGSLGEDETSVTLHEEHAHVEKESVPVEKVKLAKEKVTDTEAVTEDVAKERIEPEGVRDVDPRDRR